jgi:hypothetical protein
MVLNVLPIFAAAIVSVMIGYVWFHPKLFGSVWMQHIHLTPEMVEEGKRHTFSYVIFGFAASSSLRTQCGSLENSFM